MPSTNAPTLAAIIPFASTPVSANLVFPSIASDVGWVYYLSVDGTVFIEGTTIF